MSYKNLAIDIANTYGIPKDGFLALINQESTWNPLAVSPAGAMGLGQFMPETWADWGDGKDPFDPEASLDAAARYLRWIRQWLTSQGVPNGWDYVLASYNAGIGTVRNAYRNHGAGWFDVMPKETRDYVAKLYPHFTEKGIGPGALPIALIVFFLGYKYVA